MDSSLKALIESSGGEILAYAGECMLVRRIHPTEQNTYYISTAVRHSYGDKLVFRFLGGTEAEMREKAGSEEQRQQYVTKLADGEPVVYDAAWREKALMRCGHIFVAEGKNYIITRDYQPAGEEYDLEAPMHARSCMADQYPWCVDITADMAQFFLAHPECFSAYYHWIRYEKR